VAGGSAACEQDPATSKRTTTVREGEAYKFFTSLKNSWHLATKSFAEGYCSRSRTGASAMVVCSSLLGCFPLVDAVVVPSDENFDSSPLTYAHYKGQVLLIGDSLSVYNDSSLERFESLGWIANGRCRRLKHVPCKNAWWRYGVVCSVVQEIC
jgi:hypothetical protein